MKFSAVPLWDGCLTRVLLPLPPLDLRLRIRRGIVEEILDFAASEAVCRPTFFMNLVGLGMYSTEKPHGAKPSLLKEFYINFAWRKVV
jgi:hypothetical protein